MVLSLIDAQFDGLSSIVNVPSDQLRLVFCLVVAFPLGAIFKLINNVTIRHTLSIVLGLFCQYLIYRAETIYPLIMALGAYFSVVIFGRNKVRFLMFACMMYLSIFHVYRMYVDWGGYSVEITVVLMIFTCKCTSFAWCYCDGGRDTKDLSAEQLRNRLVTLPSLFEYLSFMYFFGNSLVGPACEYVDHDNFIHKRGDYAKKNRSLFPALAYLIAAFMHLGVIMTMSPTYNAEFTTTAKYAEGTFLWKLFYVFVSMQVARCRYYAAWLLGTASATVAGLNFDPEGKTIWDRYGKVVAVRPYLYEFEDNVRDKLEAWNTPCQLWLKNYVYFRIVSEQEIKANPKKAAKATNITFMTSAFWHGFYPGYYIAFFWTSIAQQTAKAIYRVREKFHWIPEPFAYILRWFLATCVGNFMGNTFVLLDSQKIWAFYKALHFAPHFLLIGLFITFNYTSLGRRSRSSKEAAKKAA